MYPLPILWKMIQQPELAALVSSLDVPDQSQPLYWCLFDYQLPMTRIVASY